MPTIAAIDVGTNSIRLTIASVNQDGSYNIVHNAREPVRLGQDVFSGGQIGQATIQRAAEGFQRFRELIDQYAVGQIKAVATSALREAGNRDKFISSVLAVSGIEVFVISAEEEARLVHLASKEKVNLRNKLALLVDVGGGSVEVSVADEKSILVTESYTIGSVRLLQILGEAEIGEKRFNQLVRQYVDATHRRLKKEIGNLKIQMCIGAGGSIESLAELRREIYGKNSASRVSLDELRGVMKMLHSLSFQERIQQLRLRPDRADVIVPAGIVLQTILEQAGLEEVIVPGIGLKDGLILETISELFNRERNSLYDQVLTSALQVGQKYCFDEQHARTVCRLALSLFDQLELHHGLGGESRLLLQVAALLHDVGQFVSLSNHHRHTFYLLKASPLIGLNRKQVDLVANIARYHRKGGPKLNHKSFEGLTPKERTTISRLAAILRLADALDHEHASKVREVSLQYRKPGFVLTLTGEGDMLLEKWAVANKGGLFEEVFGGELLVEEADLWPRGVHSPAPPAKTASAKDKSNG